MHRKSLSIALLVTMLATMLSGCPWTVHPRTEADCERQPNCGQCASEGLCGWDLELAQCVPTSQARESVIGDPGECPPPSDPRTHR